jgi:hypothetical protein
VGQTVFELRNIDIDEVCAELPGRSGKEPVKADPLSLQRLNVGWRGRSFCEGGQLLHDLFHSRFHGSRVTEFHRTGMSSGVLEFRATAP